MIENQRTPVMTHKVHEGAAHCLAPHPEGFLMCVGGDSGDLAMIQLSSSLVEVTKVSDILSHQTLEETHYNNKEIFTIRSYSKCRPYPK